MWEPISTVVSSSVTCKTCLCMSCIYLNSALCYTLCRACDDEMKGVTNCKSFSISEIKKEGSEC